MESEGHPLDDFDLVVDALGKAVRHPVIEVGENRFFVTPEALAEKDELLEIRTDAGVDPLLEIPFCLLVRLMRIERNGLLLEEIPRVEVCVDGLELLDSLLAFGIQLEFAFWIRKRQLFRLKSVLSC